MDETQKVLIKQGRKDLAQKYYEKVAQVTNVELLKTINDVDKAVKFIETLMRTLVGAMPSIKDDEDFIRKNLSMKSLSAYLENTAKMFEKRAKDISTLAEVVKLKEEQFEGTIKNI